MNQHNKPKADLLTDYVLDEVPVEQLLKELQNQVILSATTVFAKYTSYNNRVISRPLNTMMIH